ncbi:hypothetical protein [Enterobacter ludwigii]|uniref:hypothetical protein n=1 Tax=Enterobacter ludwigii TaxID=299767 RepID=UPI0024307B8B|nr:hypothetical protein [Enterobacter ludwigii]WFY38475.1 hypothetical protein NFK33_11515 [Enterobacter ludwigii]
MLESLKEYVSSTISMAAQRVSNPVFGSFVLSWCAFNWKSILYLFLSDSDIIDKITYISENSSWKTVLLFPCLSVAFLCGCLPWINNFISAWQAKPLDNNDSIDNHRKAKHILRATRLQRLQAKHDVTYDKVKTGAEKDIQGMKEQITASQARMGELTAEKEKLARQLTETTEKLTSMQTAAESFKNEADRATKRAMEKQIQIEALTKQINKNNELILQLSTDSSNGNIASKAGEMMMKAMKNG